MKDDYVLHLEQDNLTLVADESATRPGTKATLRGAFNELTVKSDGNAVNDQSLEVNEVEVVTRATLRQYVSGILNNGGIGLHIEDTPSLRLVGQGIMSSPMEAQATLPAASETALGIVKVVNEGSHGYPCPGISDRTMAGVYNPTDKYFLLLRNGADDLEKDVFISYYYTETGEYVPTADRFRPTSLPITAKPLNVIHSGQGAIFLNTTDGLFVLLAPNTNWKTWRAIKLNFAATHPGIPAPGSGGEYWRGWYAFVIGSTLYIHYTRLNNADMVVALWTGTITAANVITVTQRPLTGVNANGTAQTGNPWFHVFDAIWGTGPGQKCFGYNADGYWSGVDTAHHGDDVDWVIEGTKMRVCHDGYNYANRVGSDMSTRHNLSYVIDLAAFTLTPDKPVNYPIPFTKNGWPHPPHPPLMYGWGSNSEFSPMRSNGKALWLETDNIYIAPYMGLVENSSGVSDFENIKSGVHLYNRVHYGPAGGGAYGSPVTMGWGAMHFIDDNLAAGVAADGSHVLVEVDPYGRYGPLVEGYGPTNNRKLLTGAEAHLYRQMISVFDGDKTRLQGVYLNENTRTHYSQIGENGPEVQISISKANYDAAKAAAVEKYAYGVAGIKQVVLGLPIHRVAGLPHFGCLQILHDDPAWAGALKVTSYVFVFTPNQLTGEVTRITFGAQLWTGGTASNMRPDGLTGFATMSNPPVGIFRLDDGGYAVTFPGSSQYYVGNASNPQYVVLYDTKQSKVAFAGYRLNYHYLKNGYIGTKDFGWGYSEQSASGESYMLRSYGKTIASIMACLNGTSPDKLYTLVMSRTDAGDNVAISQFAATGVRSKILSLVPPERKVQGMDLSQDRTITRAMLANANKIPNQRDVTYPAQQKHMDSLVGKSPADHTHPQGDFVLNEATRIAYGSARLGTLTDADTQALGVTVVAELITEASRLWTRPKSVINLDPSVQIDVEI